MYWKYWGKLDYLYRAKWISECKRFAYLLIKFVRSDNLSVSLNINRQIRNRNKIILLKMWRFRCKTNWNNPTRAAESQAFSIVISLLNLRAIDLRVFLFIFFPTKWSYFFFGCRSYLLHRSVAAAVAFCARPNIKLIIISLAGADALGANIRIRFTRNGVG